MAAPQIVVEKSPWQSLFEQLPDMFFSFHKLKLQAEEAEKDRQFLRANMYIKDLQSTKKIHLQAAIDAMNDARDKGATMDIALSKLSRSSPESYTSGSDPLNQFFQQDVLQGEINNYMDVYNDANEQSRYADMGARAAEAIDRNFNGMIDMTSDYNELINYQIDNPELLEQLGVDELPRAYVEGAVSYLGKDEVRKRQLAKAKISNTKKTLNALGRLPEFSGNPNLLAALAQFQSDPSSAKVLDNMGKIFTDQPDVADAFKKRIETTDITFRNFMEGLESSREGVKATFLEGLTIQGTEEYKTKSLTDPVFVSSFKNDLAENFATWFSGETRAGNKYPPGGPKADWIKKAFNAAPANGWENASAAVEQVMAHRNWGDLTSDPAKFADAFDWTGQGIFNLEDEAEESASDNFFLKAVELYDTVDTIEGSAGILGPGFYERLGGSRDDAGGGTQVPADSTQVPADSTNVLAPTDSGQTVTPEGFSDQTEFLAKHSKFKKVPVEKLMQVYTDPNASPSLAQDIGRTLDILQKENQRNASINILEEIVFDHKTDPALTKNILSALDLLDSEGQVAQLAEAITSSKNIKTAFAQTGQDIDLLAIINQWQSEGSPNVGDWLAREFEMIEPEYIR